MKVYEIKSDNFTTEELVKILASIPCDDEEKSIEFNKGEYYVDADKLPQEYLYITNTAGDNEYSKNEIPHLNRAPLYFKNLKNLTVNGNGAKIIIRGKSSNMVIRNCENITIRDLTITAENPELHELKIVDKGLLFVDYKVDDVSIITSENNKLYFEGYDYHRKITDKAKYSWWTVHYPCDRPGFCHRVAHPMRDAFKIKKIDEKTIRAYTFSAKKFNIGDKYYIYDVRRQYVGIFVENSKNVTLENVKQPFSYSLAFVAQNTENITLDRLDFTPEKDRVMSSVADFIQICMCRGKVIVKDSKFSGAGDDCMNVHGFHFKIVDRKNDKITVRFMHPQSHGFNPFEANDEIAFIDPEILLEKGKANVLKSTLIDEYNIELTLDNTENAITGEFIENVTACPQVDFVNNQIDYIVTRGLLLTTRGKVNIENNRFGSMGMSGILLSDDANNWFESGMCQDVTIRNNTFDYCGENGVLIKPENTKHKGFVHKNITIEGNTFKKCERPCFSVKSSENVVIKNNKVYNTEKELETENSIVVQ